MFLYAKFMIIRVYFGENLKQVNIPQCLENITEVSS